MRLELVEQPVKAQDLEGMKYVTERVHTPIMADESVFGPTEVIELIRMRAADIINIKLMKTGGMSNAIHIADIAAMYQVECMIGCMVETSISVSAAVHLAVAKSNVITKVDLDGPSLCAVQPRRRRRDLQRIRDHRDGGTRPRHPRDPRPGSIGGVMS